MSDLVERVARKIDPWAWQDVGDGKMSNIPAAVYQRAVSLKRAPEVIKAVAEFLSERACVSASPASSYEYLAARDLMKQPEAAR